MARENPYNSERVIEKAREMDVNWSKPLIGSGAGYLMAKKRVDLGLTAEEVCDRVNQKQRELGIDISNDLTPRVYQEQELGYTCLDEHIGVVAHILGFNLERDSPYQTDDEVKNSYVALIQRVDAYLIKEHSEFKEKISS